MAKQPGNDRQRIPGRDQHAGCGMALIVQLHVVAAGRLADRRPISDLLPRPVIGGIGKQKICRIVLR